jgi:hypothetical protein
MDREQIKTRIRGGLVETPKKANKAKPAPKAPKKSARKKSKAKAGKPAKEHDSNVVKEFDGLGNEIQE